MKKEIQESISFLMKEFKRLKKKKEEKKLTNEEKEILKKLGYFLSQNKK